MIPDSPEREKFERFCIAVWEADTGKRHPSKWPWWEFLLRRCWPGVLIGLVGGILVTLLRHWL